MQLGFIRDELDMKFLILFILKHLREPVAFNDFIEMALVDTGVTYFELASCFMSLVELGNISDLGHDTYEITLVGRNASDAYEERLRSSVREKALAAIMRVQSRIRRDRAIVCETIVKDDKTTIARMRMSDETDAILNLEMLCVSPSQAAMLQKNFKQHAEKIYNEILVTLTKDRSEQK